MTGPRIFTESLDTLAGALEDGAAWLDTPTIPWKRIVAGLLWAVYLFETLVALRQYRLYDEPTPPNALVAHVSLDTFRKSQAYGKDKARMALVSQGIEHAFSLAVVAFDVYARVWVWSGDVLDALGVPAREVTQTAVWVVLMAALREAIAVPLTVYRHFVIEERHGFNKLTLKTYTVDMVKEWALSMAIGVPLVALVVVVIRWAGRYFVVYTVLFLTVVILFFTVLYPTVVQPLFNELVPLPEGALRDRVTALARTLGFPLRHLYVIDGSRRSSHSNAYFYGVVPGGSKHIVIYDTLIEKSTPEEIEAVLAHELGHWAYSHPTKLLLLSQAHLVLTLTLFTLFMHNMSLFAAFGFYIGPASASHGAHAFAPYLPVFVGLELFQLVLNPSDALLKFAINAVVRRMEYAADRFAALHDRPARTAAEHAARDLYKSPRDADEPLDATVANWMQEIDEGEVDIVDEEQETYTALLSRALVKLHVHNLSSMHHDPWYSAYHYSHPTLVERLVALDALQRKQA
ncbi:Ste24 endopeptidase [Malassezia sp. CBS 17886]|nr:Ste24 endopeptidase [Malassezia sp. CBS 17886]